MGIYRDLAHSLSGQGFVTLRYDRRGIGQSQGDYFETEFWDLVDDATANLSVSRSEVIDRLIENAQAKDADGVLAMRFDTSQMVKNWTELCACGTAVKVRKL